MLRKLFSPKPNVDPLLQEKIITGHLKAFQADPLQFFMRMAKEYGDVATFRFGPFQKIYLFSDPALIKEILVSKQDHFVKSQDMQVLKTVVGQGLLTSEKEFHLQQRRLIQPAFKKTHINKYAKDMIDTTEDYLSNWQHGDEKLLTKDMMNITLGIISKTMFSMDFNEGHEIIGEPMEVVMKHAVKRMRSFVHFPMWFPTNNNRNYKQAIKTLDEIIYEIISNRKTMRNDKEDLLAILIQAKDENGQTMTTRQLRDELMTIFLAGHETTANALSWTFFLLSQHPDVDQKLYEEIQTVTQGRPLQPDHFSQLIYAQNIIWESLRLYPPAYVISRKVDKAVKIGDISLKKGEMVMLSPYVMHRQSNYFPDPHSFQPERFEKAFMKELPPFAFFPFGGGPRVCIGNHFALMESVLVLASISQRYRLELAPNHHNVIPQPLITLRPKRGLNMIVHDR